MSDNKSKSCLKPITSVGLVCTDHIFLKRKGRIKYITSTGGGSAGNTVVYLTFSGQKTNIISVIGDDETGRIALQDFKRLNVDTSGIITRAGSSTKQYAHVINEGYARDHDFKKKCPVCSNLYPNPVQFRNSYLEKKHLDIIRNSRLVHVDRISESYLKLAKLAKDNGIPVVVDLGTVYKRFTKKETIKKAIKYADIIQIPENNEEFLQEKLDIGNFWDINQEIKGWVVTTNNGKMKARVKENGKEKDLLVPVIPVKDVVDTGGAGDTFFAHFILALDKLSDHFSNIDTFTAKEWKEAVSSAGKIASESCRYYGARGYLYSMLAKREGIEEENKLAILEKYGEQLGKRCPCKKKGNTSLTAVSEENLVKLIKKKKGRNLFETNMLNMPGYVSWTLMNTKRNGFSSENKGNMAFVGSGGSYTVATA
ncbi:MAG: carbohydrate kinase family protein, partial [Candidatus Odinarchaeota archaeon]